MKQKALLLLSGGIDSPVAGLFAKQKGFDLEAIHFSQEPFTDNTPEKKSLASAKKLGLKEMIVVNIGQELKTITDVTYREYYFILMKRLMIKISEKIAEKKGISFLITGESMGQVSSQTLSNLNNINNSVKIEILRPLIFMNKQEIVDESIKQGFFEISKGREMCDVLASGKPKTISKINKVLVEEKKCKMDLLVKSSLKNVRIEKIVD